MLSAIINPVAGITQDASTCTLLGIFFLSTLLKHLIQNPMKKQIAFSNPCMLHKTTSHARHRLTADKQQVNNFPQTFLLM